MQMTPEILKENLKEEVRTHLYGYLRVLTPEVIVKAKQGPATLKRDGTRNMKFQSAWPAYSKFLATKIFKNQPIAP